MFVSKMAASQRQLNEEKYCILRAGVPKLFFYEGQIIFPFFNVGPGRSVTENYMGWSDYQYYCGDFIMILNVFIMLD